MEKASDLDVANCPAVCRTCRRALAPEATTSGRGANTHQRSAPAGYPANPVTV